MQTTRELYDCVSNLVAAAQFPSVVDAKEVCLLGLLRNLESKKVDPPAEPILSTITTIIGELYQAEISALSPVWIDLPAGSIDDGQYRDQLIHLITVLSHGRALADEIGSTLILLFTHFCVALPQAARSNIDALLSDDQADTHITIPLLDLLPNVGRLVHNLFLVFMLKKIEEMGLYAALRETLLDNITAQSKKNTTIYAYDYDGTPTEIVKTYFRNTALEALFFVNVPFELPQETRFSGHWIIAPPGRGKTTLLHSMVLEDIPRDASIILMDSKGDLIDPIRNLQSVRDRLVLIEPNAEFPLALNPLDLPHSTLTQVVDNLEYVFSALLEAKMTALQQTLFRSVLRALTIGFDRPTLEIFRSIITNGYKQYARSIEKLPQDLQDFFYNEFDSKTYISTREQLTWRLRLLLENETIRTMFNAPETKLDLGKEMDRGKIIIINNSKAVLGAQGAEFFGRYFIAQVLAAAQARSDRKASAKKPVFFYIDECHNVIARDEKISTILDECRSQKIALILAHQRTQQITSPNVLDALKNCAIRFANSDDEADTLAKSLRTDTEFLRSLTVGTFAAFIRDFTPHALALKIPYTDMSALPQMTAQEHRKIRDQMRRDYSFEQKPETPTHTSPTVLRDDDDDTHTSPSIKKKSAILPTDGA
jgi:hypothetical protein